MAQPLKQRLEALEKAAARRQPTPQEERWEHAVFDAIEAAYPWRREWGPRTVAPFHWEEKPSPLDLLWWRIETSTTTAADQEFLRALPVQEGTAEELVEMLAKLLDKF